MREHLRPTRLATAVITVVTTASLWWSDASIAHAGSPVWQRGRLCNNSSQTVFATIERFVRPNDPNSSSRWIMYRVQPGICTDRSIMDVEGVWGKSCSSSSTCWFTLWKVGENTVTMTDAPAKSTRYTRGMYFSYGWVNLGGSWRDPYGEPFSHVRPGIQEVGYSLFHRYP